MNQIIQNMKRQVEVIEIEAGQHLDARGLAGLAGQDGAAVIAIRVSDDLHLRFSDGTQLLIKDYYLRCVEGVCSVSVAAEGGETHLVVPEETTGIALADGTELVLVQGDAQRLAEMSGTDSSLAQILDGLSKKSEENEFVSWRVGDPAEERDFGAGILLTLATGALPAMASVGGR